MNKLIEKAQEREFQGVPNLINLAERNEKTHMSELVDNLPNYKDSNIWQEMIRKKAHKPETIPEDTTKQGRLRRNFSIRSPLNFMEIADKKSFSTTKHTGGYKDSTLMQ